MTDSFAKVVNWNTVNIAAICMSENTNVIKRNFHEPDDFIAEGIRFLDNYWDFPGTKRAVDDRHPRFDFSQIKSKPFRVTLKLLVIREKFIRDNSFEHTKETFLNLVKFLKYLETVKYIEHVEYITPSMIEDFLNVYLDKSYSYRTHLIDAIEKFVEELEYCGYVNNGNYTIQSFLGEIRRIKQSLFSNKNKQSSKHPNIPQKYYKAIIQCALEDMQNVSLQIENRIMACCIVILGETGMRLGECRILEAGKLHDITVFEGKPKAYKLEFWTYKTTLSDGRWTVSKAFTNMIEAYRLIEALTKEKREQLKINHLVTNRNGNVLCNATFYHRYYNFFHRNREKLSYESLANYEKSQLKPHIFGKWNLLEYREEKTMEWIGEIFYSVTPHQYRVHMANFLRDKGVSLEWIKQHMNHLSEEMTKWYFRDPEEIKKAMHYRSSSDGTALEPNEYTAVEMSEEELKEAYDVINKFLKKKKLNLFKDIDEILEIWKNNPLNDSLVGLCRKAVGAICNRQDKLSTLEKWYYLSPQFPDISSFDFTFKRFMDKVKIVEHNKTLFESNDIYKRTYDVEYGALRKYYENRLKPEYDLFLSNMEEKGVDYILTNYPNLNKIVNRLDSIEKEVREWVTKLKLENPLINEQQPMELVD